MSQTRYMRRDVLSLDDVAIVNMQFPDKLSPDELKDVQEWFALRVRAWERAIAGGYGESNSGKAVTP